jgi:hypothetical protein
MMQKRKTVAVARRRSLPTIAPALREIQFRIAIHAGTLETVMREMRSLRDKLEATPEWKSCEAEQRRTDGRAPQNFVHRLACDLSHICGWSGQQDALGDDGLWPIIHNLREAAASTPRKHAREEARRQAASRRGAAGNAAVKRERNAGVAKVRECTRKITNLLAGIKGKATVDKAVVTTMTQCYADLLDAVFAGFGVTKASTPKKVRAA